MRFRKKPAMRFRKKPVVIEATQWFKMGDHPVKELTDEEIEIAKNESTVFKGIYDGYGNGIGQKREIDYKLFAKAILRKAWN